MLKGKVLVTGGSGYLGRGILRRIRRDNWPAEVTVYSRDETKQWELKKLYPDARCILGDVRDYDRLESAIVGHDLVIHAGAVKYIPEAEHNVLETIAVNVDGSANVARAASRAGVQTVVGISTDKACAPLNTYGMTKALMERMYAEANQWSDTNFMTVRYGNVVGSTGSVIPLFRRQIEEYNEIRITDRRMTRFWLSIDQAIDLIDAAAHSPGMYGATYIDKCPAMSIEDLARAVWSEGAGKEGQIVQTGIRPGEKLHEMLYNEQEACRVLDDGYRYLLLPATQRPVAGETGVPACYESSAPAHTLTEHEMLAMIEDAQHV